MYFPKTKVKVKSCAHSRETPSSLCIVDMETSPGIHVLTQPKHISEGITVRGPQTGGRLLRTAVIECSSIKHSECYMKTKEKHSESNI